VDLRDAWSLGRRFHVALCLEVAEHLEESDGERLISALTAHADTIVFSAAAPGQPGQHHVNCQWPEYWQRLFDERGYVCDDSIRWTMWHDPLIEPWYRQNCMICKRDAALAGSEPRIRPVVHPDMLACMCGLSSRVAFHANVRAIQAGTLPARWYVSVPFYALSRKLGRSLRELVRRNGARTSH
jgi:hypothetical protein